MDNNLAIAFRKALEYLMLDNISDKRFLNIVKDFYQLSPAEEFLWKLFCNCGVLSKFCDCLSNTTAITQFITKTVYQTGSDISLVTKILNSLWGGLMMAHYGAYPDMNQYQDRTLADIFVANYENWIKRHEEVKDGIITVKVNNRYGFLNCSGKEILPIKYKGITPFSEGLACVNDGNIFGFINLLGNLEIDLKSKLNDLFSDGLYGVGIFDNGIAELHGSNGKIGYLSISGEYTKLIFEENFSSKKNNPFVISQNGKYGLMNHKCQIVLSPQFEEIDVLKEEFDYIFARRQDASWCILNRKGQIVKNGNKFPPSITSNNLICLLEYIGTHIKFKFLNNSLQSIINLPIAEVLDSGFDPILVHSQNGLYFFIDCKGIKFNTNGYEKAFPFSGTCTWVKIGITWYRVDILGNVLQSITGYEILSKEINNRVLRRNISTGLIEVFDAQEGIVKSIIPDSTDILVSERVGRISSTSEYEFNDGVRYFMWTKGCLFSSVAPFITGFRFGKFLIAKKNEVSYEVSYECKILGNITLNSDERIVAVKKTANNDILILVKSEQKYYLYNLSKSLKSFDFDEIEAFHEGCKAVIISNNAVEKQLIDCDFNVIFNAKDIFLWDVENLFEFEVDGKYGIANDQGIIIMPPLYDSITFSKTF